MLGLILLGAAILHGAALRLPFFADDFLFLETVRGRGLFAALAAPDPIGNFFRPVGRQLYFWLIGHASHESPLVFHAANLALFLVVVALVFAIARRLAGTTAAAFAAGFIALHYAADVPVRWVSGSQELIAAAGALGAIALTLAGRRFAAAAALLIALLSKESVALTPVIAMVAAREPGEPWRRSATRVWPLAVAVAVWAALWIATLSRRPALGGSLGLEPWGAVAVLAHLMHVAIGLEWRGALQAVGRAVPPFLPLIPIAIALIVVGRAPRSADRRGVYTTALVWALAGVAPLVAVASFWSAYFYLFALCGVALGLGALVARWPRWAAVALLALLATGSQSGRASAEFATGRGAWNMQSRINRLYLDRAMVRITRYVTALRRAHADVPPRTTFFFGGVPSFVAWQTGDGPIVRWAYRDTTLRSYYQSDFTLARARRGPTLFFSVYDDSMTEVVQSAGDLRGIAMNTLLNDKFDATDDVLTYMNERGAPSVAGEYFLAWVKWARGDSSAARALLMQAQVRLERGPTPEAAAAHARAAAGDTVGAMVALQKAIVAHGLDPAIHSELCELLLHRNPDDSQARVEALAYRALAPGDTNAWIRWGLLQAHDARYSHALESLQRSLDLGGLPPMTQSQVRDLMHELRRASPGGDLVQRALSMTPRAP
ncbi:MAG: hypothetical protein HYR74_12585 [Candidatus Eisenbacteria bacterium]|nr:hypothetical protein [Candidatus Eisenbacteria bacterium]